MVSVLGNVFWAHRETKWLNEYNLNKPKFYSKYAEDILAVFDKEQDSLSFCNVLNKKHLDIKFTIGKQVKYFITVLDVFFSGTYN